MPEKVCLINGASRGIGRATAVALHHAGWKLVLVARSPEALEKTAAGLADAICVPGDVTRRSDIAAAIAAGLERFGRIDAAVACAGAAPLAPLAETTDEQFRQAIETNLSHSFYVMRELWPIFLRQGGGAIVNFSSFSARDPFNGFAAYAAAKAGINLMSLVAAREGAAHNIRVHVVAPGAVETEMLRGNFPESMLPPDLALPPESVARVVVQILDGSLACTSGEVIWVHK
jgi:NAD(P)-dependent dehydrogenase (short-subunit alcohol dehydrogenase family)